MADSGITKKALAEALKQLMEEMPFAKISVADICEHCDMNRKSFYYHFRDKYDLVNWIFYTEFIMAVGQSDCQNAWSLFSSMCAYFYRERVFYRSALRIEGQNSFQSYFREVVTPLLQDLFQELYTIEGDPRYFFDFCIDAFLSALVRWLTQERSLTDREFLERMRAVLITLAHATLKNTPEEPELPR